MNTGALIGWFGGIVGAVLGIAGGIFGTYCSIKNTTSARQRAFMIKASVTGWVVITVFLILLIVLPSPYRWFLWIPYGLLLPVGIIYTNKRMNRIRLEDIRDSVPQ